MPLCGALILSSFSQFVYQPAMMYISNGKIEHEGLAVFSRYPIISSDYKLLSRYLSVHCVVHVVC